MKNLRTLKILGVCTLLTIGWTAHAVEAQPRDGFGPGPRWADSEKDAPPFSRRGPGSGLRGQRDGSGSFGQQDGLRDIPRRGGFGQGEGPRRAMLRDGRGPHAFSMGSGRGMRGESRTMGQGSGRRLIEELEQRHPGMAERVREKIREGTPPREILGRVVDRLDRSEQPADRELAERIRERHPRLGGTENADAPAPQLRERRREHMDEAGRGFGGFRGSPPNAPGREGRERARARILDRPGSEGAGQPQADVRLGEQIEQMEERLQALRERRQKMQEIQGQRDGGSVEF